MFAISLARGKSSQTIGDFSVFFSHFRARKLVVSPLLAWISSVLSRHERFIEVAKPLVQIRRRVCHLLMDSSKVSKPLANTF